MSRSSAAQVEATPQPPRTTAGAPNKGAPAAGSIPQTSVSVDWILAQTGPLVDGSVASLRFRENVESAAVSLVELEAWVLQALRKPDDRTYRNAAQDLVHAVAKRLGFKVQYGAYDRSSPSWLPFAGLWWLDSRNFVCVDVHADRMQALDLERIMTGLASVHDLGGIFAEAHGAVILVLANGYNAELEPALRSPAALQAVRLLGIDTLFDVARMHEEGVLVSAQMPILFAPFDSMRLGQVVDFLERFVARFEESAEGSNPVGAIEPQAMTRAASENGPAPDGPRLRLVTSSPPPAAAVASEAPPPKATATLTAVPPPERRLGLETLKEVFALFKAGKYNECLPLLEKFLNINDSNPKAWEIYGDLSVRTDRHGEAIRAYSRVLALAPPTQSIAYRLSNLSETQGDLREAVRVLEDFARAVPAEARKARESTAQLLARGGDFRSAVELCEQLLRSGPWSRELVELQERCERQLGTPQKTPASRPAPYPVGRLGSWLANLLGRR